MPGNIVFRPVEANITHDTNWLGKMDPYCRFSIGATHAQSSVCRHGGTRPHWGDLVTLPIVGTPTVVRLELFDKDKFRPDDHIAYADIDLAEIERQGSISKWYPLYHHKKPAGEILIEAAIQQPQVQQVQQVVVQQVVPTTYVQETITSVPIDGVVGQSYVVDERVISQTTVPVQTTEYITTSSYNTVDPSLGLANAQPTVVNPNLVSKTSFFGPSGGLPHGFHKLKGETNAGYSERPGYTLGDTEANPTCQSNLDSNGGGFFNKPGREKRAEPYSLSNPGTYGIPHGQTIDTAGHLRPDVTLSRQAPIGTVNHPGITGYVDGYNVPQQQLHQVQAQQGLYDSGATTGLQQAGSYTTGLGQPVSYTTGSYNPGSYTTGLNTGLGQPVSYTTGSYTTGLNTGLGQPGSYTTGLTQPGSYTTTSSLGQPGSYTTGQPVSYTTGQPGLVQGNLINSLGQLNLGQSGQTGLVGQGVTQQGVTQLNPGLNAEVQGGARY